MKNQILHVLRLAALIQKRSERRDVGGERFEVPIRIRVHGIAVLVPHKGEHLREELAALHLLHELLVTGLDCYSSALL